MFKIAKIIIRNNTAKDGKIYGNVVKRELVNDGVPRETAESIINNHEVNGIAGSGMQPVPPTTLPNDAFNDLVPF